MEYRLKGKDLPKEKVAEAISRLYHIYCEGMNAFVQFTASAAATAVSASPRQLSDYYDLERENHQLRGEVTEFFVAISRSDEYVELFLPQLLPSILSVLLLSPDHAGQVTESHCCSPDLVLSLLTAMLQKSESTRLLSEIFVAMKQFSALAEASTETKLQQRDSLTEILQLFAKITRSDRNSSSPPLALKVVVLVFVYSMY